MRTLSGTLTTAQKAQSSRPHPKVEVFDNAAGVVRYHWTRYYTGAEDDYFHAATVPGDGSLIRLRVDESTRTLYRQRVTSPGSGSTYSAWTSWGVDAFAVALTSYGSYVWAFRIDATDGHLYYSISIDSGATWGSWTDMGDISGDATFRLAAINKSAGELIVMYSDGTDVYRNRYTGGAWEGFAAWSLTLASVSGIAVSYMGDWNVVVTGTEETTTRPGVWICVLGDGYVAAADTWTALQEVLAAESDASMAYKFPSTLNTGVERLWFVEAYTDSEAYSRPYWTHAPTGKEWEDNYWREPVPFDLASAYGVAMCVKSPDVWLCRPDGVWRAASSAVSAETTDDVLELKATLRPSKGALAVVLTNHDGSYANIGVAGNDYEALTLGAELRFSPGYHTTAGGSPEHSTGVRYWIEALEFISAGVVSSLLIEATDWWGLLERWKARRQFVWAEGDKNIYQLLQFVLARVGLNLTTVGTTTAALTDLKPAFTINPGESGRTAALRLLAMVEDVLYFNSDTGYLNQPQSGDSSDYTYGTDHHVLEARCRTSVMESNRAQVTGDDLFTEDFDWSSIDLVGDTVAQDHDLTLDTTTRAHRRGDAMLRRGERDASGGHIIVPLNCGQQLYDVLTITDARAPISAATRRVGSLDYTYIPRRAIHTLRIGLEAL